MDFLDFLLAFGFLAQTIQGFEDSPCAELKRKANIEKCLESIGQQAKDKSLFWFGEEYSSRCDEDSLYIADCFNPRPRVTDSLISRVYSNGVFDDAALDKFIEVTYSQESGSYFACENDFETTEESAITVDPLSNNAYTPWQLRTAPVYRWDYDEGDLYTLIFYDVGYMFIKSFIINIPGSDVSNGEVILSYEGPMNPTRNRNPYVFMLFKQSGYLRITPDWRNILYQRSSTFDQTEFDRQFNLTGPLALNWIQVTGDPYAAEHKKTTGYMNTCPYFVSEAFKSHQLEFLPEVQQSAHHDLIVYINVTFTSPAVTFNSCCSVYEYPAATFSLNPLGNGYIQAAYLRSDVVPMVALSMATAFPNINRDFKDKLLTLMVLDGDVPFPQFGDKAEPFLHWLVVNIYDGNVTKGQTVAPYVGPAPPDSKPHTYHYLLFEQDYVLHPSEIGAYANADCSHLFKGRCRYKSKTVIQNHNLQLIGATWHVTANDEYVRYVYTSLGMPWCDVCKNVEGFASPCATADSINTLPSVLSVFLWIFIYMIIAS
ncbi:hypothetical protein SNE40_021502 [Patella caerulea]|uniref:Uncharacterized protein n=1 Tax=Patella caerulea TaxID=87958 RepID=A0AAN8GCQ4_PATCE